MEITFKNISDYFGCDVGGVLLIQTKKKKINIPKNK